MATPQKSTAPIQWHITIAVFWCIGVAVAIFFPHSITPVPPDKEDIKAYIAKLELQEKKVALQRTLPQQEAVIELYEKPIYVQAINTCNWQYTEKECVLARIGPGESYGQVHLQYEKQGPSPAKIREGQVFPVNALIQSKTGSLWYKIAIEKPALSFPGRFETDWYVPAKHFTYIDTTPINPQNDAIKRIEIILHRQQLRAYEGDTLFMETAVSTGQDYFGLSTDIGAFEVYRKTIMKIMEGPLPGMASLATPNNIADFEYTLFVPYAMAFYPSSMGTAYIHAAYWHNGFGTKRSHGCVNLHPNDAATLYRWTPDPAIIKTPVIVLP